MKHAIILIGPPGSGKTTITEQLVSDRSVQALETGSLLREQVANETETGEGAETVFRCPGAGSYRNSRCRCCLWFAGARFERRSL